MKDLKDEILEYLTSNPGAQLQELNLEWAGYERLLGLMVDEGVVFWNDGYYNV